MLCVWMTSSWMRQVRICVLAITILFFHYILHLRYRSLCSVSFQMHAQNFHSNIHFAEQHPDESNMCEAGTGF